MRKVSLILMIVMVIGGISACEKVSVEPIKESKVKIETMLTETQTESKGEVQSTEAVEKTETQSEATQSETTVPKNLLSSESPKVNDLMSVPTVEQEIAQLEDIKGLVTVINYNLDDETAVEVTNPTDLLVLVNKKNALPEGYRPDDLVVPDVRFSFEGENEKKYMRQAAADALKLLFDGAESDGLHLFALSGFRSYEKQRNIFNYFVGKDGEEAANKYSARPGQSEHQTGLAMDVTAQSVGFDLKTALGEQPEGIWLAEHAHEYGFIIRYPKDKVDITGYQYEPWHLRYVGVDIAGYIYSKGICYEEFYGELVR